MINGFLIEIKNRSNEWESLSLFKEGGENLNIDLKVLHEDYDYKALLFMANSKGFKGRGIHSDFIEKVTIHKSSGSYNLDFKRFVKNEEILIDGFSSCLTIEVPPMSHGYFQLLPAMD